MTANILTFICPQAFFLPSGSHTAVHRRKPPRLCPRPNVYRSSLRASASPPLSSPTGDEVSEVAIPGTPCFTPRILVSPMPQVQRDVYLRAAASATAAYLSQLESDASSPAVAQITLLLPQLNPELDVYDRRFLLGLTWAVLDVTASSCRLRTRVLIQGTGAFGAIPLSIAGLRRHFDADLDVSREAWPDCTIRSGFLENPEDLTDDDEIIIVISPTNAVSVPVVDSLVDMVGRARGRPIILLNPRLADVPSHSGVMQVSGRTDRMRFLESIADIFYIRLLFNAGTMYPLRGVLYRAYPDFWEIWRADADDANYSLISSLPERPGPSEITDAFALDRYSRQKKLHDEAVSSGHAMSLESLFLSPVAMAVVTICATLGVAHFLGSDVLNLARNIMGPQKPM